MNPFYARLGSTRKDAFVRAIKMTHRWGDRWYIFKDQEDGDFLVFARDVGTSLSSRYRKIGYTYVIPNPHNFGTVRVKLI